MGLHTPSRRHWLSALLAPRSVALVGASPRAGSIGHKTFKLLRGSGYRGTIYPVNPRYDNVETHRCFASLADLPEPPDLVVFGIGGSRLEQAFDDAIAKGAGGAVIFANNYLHEDGDVPLLERLRRKARRANIPVCGGNGMGFYNYDVNTMVSFDAPPDRPAGHIALIVHSGSAMSYLANNDVRYRYNLVVSPGQEINATAADYMDYALTQPTTKVLALFIETVRDTAGFIAALRTAHERDIPVVIAKVGRTEKSARFAASHSGAVVGNDDVFRAVCEHYGAIKVRDLDELAATALALAHDRRAAAGSLASLLDSGGLREQFIDLADELGVRFAQISERTRERLTAHLEFGLDADNPVDAMGALNADVHTTFRECGRALLDDPDTALLTFEFEFRNDFCHYPELFDVAKELLQVTDKPIVLVSSSATVMNARKAAELSDAGLAVINGSDTALRTAGNMLRYRDRRQCSAGPEVSSNIETIGARWRHRLREQPAMDESMALRMLSEFDIPTVSFRLATTIEETQSAAAQFGYPVVLKTAAPNIAHKTEVDGVVLSLNDSNQLRAAYTDLEGRLGPRVLVAPMAAGIELAFGMVNDPQFGPVVVVSAGGIHVETFDDRLFVLPPFDEEYAFKLIERLKIHSLLLGVRGKAPCRIDVLARALSRFSIFVTALGDCIAELDLNPVIAGPDGCVVADALVVPKTLAGATDCAL